MSENTMYIVGIFLFLLIIIIVRMYSNKTSKASCMDSSKKKKDKTKKKSIKDSYDEPSKEINIKEKINSTLDSSKLSQWSLSNAIDMFKERQNAYIKKINIIP